jgi:hypothetical protein
MYVVSSRNQRRRDEAEGVSMADRVCMICGKAINDDNEMKWFHENEWLAFDDMGCRNKFIGNPKKYLEAEKA